MSKMWKVGDTILAVLLWVLFLPILWALATLYYVAMVITYPVRKTIEVVGEWRDIDN